MRLTLDEYSRHFRMSKEMISSKLKEKKLNYIIDDGVTYILVTRNSIERHSSLEVKVKSQEEAAKALVKPKITVATVLALYQRENQQLKEKIAQLESKIDKLVDDKEQMLRDEMNKIEQVYSAKDEQLKNILELVNAKLMLDNRQQTVHEIQNYEAIEDTQTKDKKFQLIELREYLRTLDLKSHQRKIIKKRFLAVYDNDIRVLQQNGKLFLDFSKYDYSDLLEY
ncbi:MAG: hypothetical protein NTW78_11225 [Campylobacterales bacterium]|nr:hypothetical protein [Campylobacterales bacterium]